MEIDPVVIPVGDTNQQQETEKSDFPSVNAEESEIKTDEEKTLLEVSDVFMKNGESLNPKDEMKIHDESIKKVVLKKIYSHIIGSTVFLVNKVLIPFGEHVLLNSTLWILLISALEVFLEMLLYIIFAICYVFLKFISQVDNKNKPEETEEETTAS